MPSVQIPVTSTDHLLASFSWYEVFASETNWPIASVEANAEFNTLGLQKHFIHANLAIGETWYYWGRSVFERGASATTLVLLGSVTITGAGEHMPAWTLKGRNAATTGTPHNIDFNDLTEESAPAAGDKLVGYINSGELRMFDIGNLPGGGESGGSGGSEGGGIGRFGALIGLTAGIAGSTPGHGKILWTSVDYDTEWDPEDGGATQRFWLGADFTFATTDVDTGADTITETGHGFTTGEGPVQFTTTTTLPAGISASTNYWTIVVDANTFKVATSRANALAGTQVDITSQGTGTHTCDRGAYLVIPKNVSYVKVGGFALETSDLAGQLSLLINKNGAVFRGWQFFNQPAGQAAATLWTPRIPVSEGDRFTLEPAGQDAFTLRGGTDGCWFAIEVVEGS